MTWHTFSDPRFALMFRYPYLTPTGHVLEHVAEAHDNVLTIRFTANQGHDAYFEVSRFADDSAVNRFHSLRASPGGLIIGEAQAAQLAGNPALTFSLQRGTLQREVFLVQRDASFYRITFDPRVPFNYELLATLRFLAH